MNLYESVKTKLKESEKEIKIVTPDIISKYIEYWDGSDTSDPEIVKIYEDYDLLLANENGRWVAIDNRSGNCWTEEFPNKEDAIAWLRDEFEMSDYMEESCKGKKRKRRTRKLKEAEVHTVDNDPIWKAAVEKVQKEYGIDKEVKANDFESKRDFLYAMYDKIKEAWEAIEWHNEMYYEPDMYPTDLELILIVNWGDWKHDHIAIDHIAEQATHPIEISENVTEEDGSDTYSAEHYYKYSEAQYKEWLKNGSLKEAEDYDPDFAVTSPIELNTGVLPIVDVDQYSRQEYIWGQEELMNDVDGDGSKILEPGDEGYFEITTDELDKATMRIAPHVIENYIDVVLPGSKVEATKMYHPRQYNFGGDELEFKVSFVPDNYKQLEKEVTSNPEFKNFLKENYSSHSGFISSMADNLDEFYQQDGWKQFVQVVMFALRDHKDDMQSAEESMWESIMQEVL